MAIMGTSIEQNLEQKIRNFGNPVDMLRNAEVGAYQFPFASEYSN
jgi:hypothetical protein